MVEILKQGQYTPQSLGRQVAIIWTGANGYLDDLELGVLDKFEKEFLAFVEKDFPDIVHNIENEKTISDETDKKLHDAAKKFKEQFKAGE